MESSRKLLFEGIRNARDLGGLPGGDGRHVRTGALIRSANLSKATQEDIRHLTEDLHLSMVIDLRTSMAAGMKPDVEMEGVVYQAMPIFDDAMIGVTHESDRDYARRKTPLPDMRMLYRMMVSREECRERFGRVLTLIMEHDFEQGSVLWHCSEGKDRCGLTTAFLLSALDVPGEEILEDYLLTNETAEERADYYYSQVMINVGDEKVAESVRNAFVVKKEYLQSAFDFITETYGNTRRYMTEGLGVGEETLDSFREKMLV